MLPTLRQLQYLKLLAEHGSFSRAAEAAHVTQPTLSAGIAELERIIGAPVVDRARSGVILTAAGEEAGAQAFPMAGVTGGAFVAYRHVPWSQRIKRRPPGAAIRSRGFASRVPGHAGDQERSCRDED